MKAKQNKQLVAIKKAIDILIKARVAGAGVAVAKWAEERGYNLKGETNGRQRRYTKTSRL
jgi:hypothetical protein